MNLRRTIHAHEGSPPLIMCYRKGGEDRTHGWSCKPPTDQDLTNHRRVAYQDGYQGIVHRETLIQLLLENYLSTLQENVQIARDVLDVGFQGFRNYLDQELLEAAKEAELIDESLTVVTPDED